MTKNTKERKTEIIVFRVTKDEKSQLTRDSGMLKNLSKYIRNLLKLDD